jgi:oligopeptide transport system substrate-binding protein
VPFSPARGRALLDEREGGIDDIEMIYTGGSVFDPLVSTLRDAWREGLGAGVIPTSVEWPEFFRRLMHDPAPIAVMGYAADYPDPDAMLRVLFHSQQGYNLPGWHQEDFDRLVEQAARMLDPQARLAAYREADRILVNEAVAVLPLGYAQGRTLVKPHLGVPSVPPMWMLIKEMTVGQEDA